MCSPESLSVESTERAAWRTLPGGVGNVPRRGTMVHHFPGEPQSSLALGLKFIVAVALMCFATGVAAQNTLPLLYQDDLVYEGAFRVPQGPNEQDTFNYGGTALAYNAANKSLYLVGHDWYQRSAEITIPEVRASNDKAQLARATFLQGFKNPVEGRLNEINPSDPNSKKIGGQLVYEGQLYVTGYSYYDAAVTQRASHFARPLSLSDSGNVIGPVKVGGLYPGYVAGYMAEIPADWRDAFGGPVLTGNCCVPGGSWQSQGPAASVFNPSDIGKTTPVPAAPVLGYPLPNELGPGHASTNEIYNMTTRITGITFPPGTRSVLFFGRHGIGPYCYGSGAECNDPADSSKGTHAYPYVYQVWAYDANDLLAVRQGKRAMHSVEPYAIWNFDLPFQSGQRQLGGVALDPETKRLYVSQRCGDTDCSPVIHVFKIGPGRAEIKPNPPTDVAAQ